MNRYSRQIAVSQIGSLGHNALRNATVCIVGVGGLGSIAAELLCREGIKKLILIDRDIVEEHNLQRQSLYTMEDLQTAKVLAAKKHLQAINPEIEIEIHAAHLSARNIAELIPSNIELLLDCSDNISLRMLLNDYALHEKISWIYAGATGTQVAVAAITPQSPCLSCFIPESAQGESCAQAGILAATLHSAASMQHILALKLLTKQNVEAKIHYFSIWDLTLRSFAIKKDPSCVVCSQDNKGKSKTYSEPRVRQFCSSGIFQVLPQHKSSLDLQTLHSILSVQELPLILDTVSLRIGPAITLFADGRALIKANSSTQALKLYAEYCGY